MAADEVVPGERLREELDELHERLAALSGRVADLERDRDALYTEAEVQGDRMERAEGRLRRSRLSLRKALARAAATRRGDVASAAPPGAGSAGEVETAGGDTSPLPPEPDP